MNRSVAKPRYHSPAALAAEGADARSDPECGRCDPAARAGVGGDDRGGGAGSGRSPSGRSIVTSRRARICSAPSWRRALRAFIRGQTQQVETLEQNLDLTRAADENFDANEGIVRAIISAPEGVEVRKRPAEVRLDMLRKAYGKLLAGVPEGPTQKSFCSRPTRSPAHPCGLTCATTAAVDGERGRQDRRAGDRAARRGHQGTRQDSPPEAAIRGTLTNCDEFLLPAGTY